MIITTRPAPAPIAAALLALSPSSFEDGGVLDAWSLSDVRDAVVVTNSEDVVIAAVSGEGI